MSDAPSIDGYDILRELGRGAMGVVYLARDRFLEREVAIKLVAESELTIEAVERFLREARAMARLSHPNVVTVYRAGVTGGAPFLVMELLRGRSLDIVLESDGALSSARLLTVAIEAARGVAAAHARGVVHRDIKPSNLFETDEGTVKVLDFGIAKLATADVATLAGAAERETTGRITAQSLVPAATASIGATGDGRQSAPTPIAPTAGTASDAARSDASRGAAAKHAMAFDATLQPGSEIAHSETFSVTDTRSSGSRDSGAGTQVSGTALFMAPEVWRSEGADNSSDVWSLGATLYMLATNRPPFNGRSVAEIAFNVLVATPVEPLKDKRADLPAELIEIIERCLSKNRATRYASASEVLSELERLSRAERVARAPRTDAPYPGLRAMDAQDRDRFFGRDDDVTRVIERLRGESLVVLVGASGTGKSSLAAAGVAPAVAEGALGELRPWRVVRVRPGRSPLRSLSEAIASTLSLDSAASEALLNELTVQPDALARVLREAAVRDGQGVLLLIDQLEELVTTSAGEERDIVALALATLVEVSPRGVRVLATARSDLFDRLGSLGELGARLGRATELIRPLEGAALRQAIVEPARAAGATFEDDAIVDKIVADVGSSAGSLPLVAFAMRAWWDRRDRDRSLLERSAWESLGGVVGALGTHADAVYEGLGAEERDAARALFSRLVANDGTRRYATLAELEASASGRSSELARAIEAFSRARLVQCEGDESTGNYTIVHESLFLAWPRLRQWIDAGREDRALHQQLSESVRAWDASGHRDELLWHGALLQEITRWREVYDDTLSSQERAFVDRSVLRERRARRSGVVAVSILVLGLGGAALWQAKAASVARRASASATVALTRLEQRGRVEITGRTMAAALDAAERDPSSALAWLVSASRAAGETTSAVRIAALGLVERGVATRVRCTSRVAFGADQATVACAIDETLYAMNLADGTVRPIDAHQPPRSIAVSRDGAVLYWIDSARQLVRWDEHGGRRRIASEMPRGVEVLCDPSGARAVIVDVANDRLSVWDAADSRVDRAHDAGPSPAALNGESSLRVVLERLLPERIVGPWRLHLLTSSTAVLAVPSGVRTSVRRVSLDRGATVAGEVLDCEAYLVRDDVLLCHDASGPRAMTVSSGTERPLSAEEASALEVSRGGFERELLAETGDLRVLRDEHGRAELRGRFPFSGPLGVDGVTVARAMVEPTSHRVALVDESGTLHIYGATRSTVARSSWLAPSSATDAARARSTSSARIVTASLPDARVAVAAVGLGVFSVDMLTERVRWSALEPSTVAVGAEGNYVLLGLADGSGVLVEPELERSTRGALLENTAPVAVAVSADGARVAASGPRGDAEWRSIGRGEWRRISYRAFSELSSATALATNADRLGVAGRWLGVVQQGGLTTLANGHAAFFEGRVTRLRFATVDQLFAADDRGSAWFASCRDQRCRVEWVGRGDDVAPIARDAAVSVGEKGAVRLLVRGRSSELVVYPAGRLEGLGDMGRGQGAIDVDDNALVIAGPATAPTVLRIELPPQSPEAFARWVAARTNVSVTPGGNVQIGAPPTALP